uniref:Uncharacterized protein n=1 Tax=Chenopodium quinoa TaxID=63459 RepID=A0A803M8W7_CHEQI
MLFMSQLTLSSSAQHDEHALSYAITSSISSSKATNEVDDGSNSQAYSSNTRKLAVMFRGSPRFIPAVVASPLFILQSDHVTPSVTRQGVKNYPVISSSMETNGVDSNSSCCSLHFRKLGFMAVIYLPSTLIMFCVEASLLQCFRPIYIIYYYLV